MKDIVVEHRTQEVVSGAQRANHLTNSMCCNIIPGLLVHRIKIPLGWWIYVNWRRGKGLKCTGPPTCYGKYEAGA